MLWFRSLYTLSLCIHISLAFLFSRLSLMQYNVNASQIIVYNPHIKSDKCFLEKDKEEDVRVLACDVKYTWDLLSTGFSCTLSSSYGISEVWIQTHMGWTIVYITRSTQRAQTSLAEADHYSHIAHCKNVEPWLWKTTHPPKKKKKKKKSSGSLPASQSGYATTIMVGFFLLLYSFYNTQITTKI